MQVFQRHRAIVPGHKVFRHQLPGFIDYRAIRRGNILCRIDIKYSALLSTAFITECCAVLIGIRTCQNLAFLVNRQISKLLHIRDSRGSCLVRFQSHTVSSRIIPVSCRSRNLFQIHRILCHDNFCFRRTITVRCRHPGNQVRTVLIPVNAEYSAGKFCVGNGIHLDYLHLCTFQPVHGKAHGIAAFFLIITPNILRGAPCRNDKRLPYHPDAAFHCSGIPVPIDRHRGSKIKTCPTGNTDISPCLLAPVCLIMECHILWKLDGNGISGITVQLRCPRHLLRAIIGCFQSGLAQTDLWIGRRRQAFQIIDPTKHPALPQIIHRASGKPIHAAVKITGRDMGEHIL